MGGWGDLNVAQIVQNGITLFQFLIIQIIVIVLGFSAVAAPLNLINSGLEQLQQENYQQGRLIFNQVLKEDPEHFKAREYRCLTQLNLGELESAIADCSKVITETPHSINAYLWRGLAYYRYHNYQAAINDYNYILSQESNHTQALYNRGLAYSAIAQFSKALSDYYFP
ncbi:MAG: tetratricopeptide repeat protein [Halothece sp.]